MSPAVARCEVARVHDEPGVVERRHVTCMHLSAPLCTSLRQDTEPVKISLDLRGMRRDIPGCAVQGLQNLVSEVNQSRQASQELRISEGDSDGIDSTDVLRTSVRRLHGNSVQYSVQRLAKGP